MKCASCKHFCRQKVNVYEEMSPYVDTPSAVVTFQANAGQGECQVTQRLESETFGCIHFEETFLPAFDQVVTTKKPGGVWSYWTFVHCPDCNDTEDYLPKGHRCAGRRYVRKYDDGYVGDEQTRMHPHEKAVEALASRAKRMKQAQDMLAGVEAEPVPVAPSRRGEGALISSTDDGALAPLAMPRPE